jgi:hypothetical protein
MKRFLGLLAVIAFLVVGCAMGLQSIRPDTAPEKVVARIMKAVEGCDIDANGWKILEIPDKAYAKNFIKFVAYRSTLEDTWGVGLLNEQYGMAIILQHNTERGWVAMQFGMPMPMEDAQAIQFLHEWAQIVASEGDFSKAKTYQPCVYETPQAEVDGTKI